MCGKIKVKIPDDIDIDSLNMLRKAQLVNILANRVGTMTTNLTNEANEIVILCSMLVGNDVNKDIKEIVEKVSKEIISIFDKKTKLKDKNDNVRVIYRLAIKILSLSVVMSYIADVFIEASMNAILETIQKIENI